MTEANAGNRKQNRGKLYGVGVGPGDPELLTLKAARLIREADVIGIPGKNKESCVAWQIAVSAVPEMEEKEILAVSFPMTKDAGILEESHKKGADQTAALLDMGKNVVFLTLGDPAVYSTYGYLQKRLTERGYEAYMVSGVPSFCAAAARLGISLGEKSEALHILPGSYPLKEGLELSGTKILMKSGKQMGTVKELLLSGKKKAAMVENCGMAGERVFFSAEEIPEDAGYYSLIIVREGEETV